jgi:uncharacterized protein YceK
MTFIRVCLLLFIAGLMAGCGGPVSGVSEAEANMSSEEYDAMIEAEESQQGQQP